MALSDRYTKSVVFIIGSRSVGSLSVAEPQGTGFVVSLPSEDPNACFLYVVTAAHVVRTFAETAIRVSKQDGTTEDYPVHKWEFHDSEDVAATPIVGQPDWIMSPVEIDSFLDASEFSPVLGDPVYFVGLLGQVREMGERNIPMVRSGTLGALHQDRIPMRGPDNALIHAKGHLIDCRSFGGFSGSPCFVQFVRVTRRTPNMNFAIPEELTLLLGLVGGHFDKETSVTVPESGANVRVPVSAGVGVVYPVELIREVLFGKEELVSEREADNEEFRQAREEDGATADSMSEESEFDRFENLTRRLVRTPKPKPDESDAV